MEHSPKSRRLYSGESWYLCDLEAHNFWCDKKDNPHTSFVAEQVSKLNTTRLFSGHDRSLARTAFFERLLFVSVTAKADQKRSCERRVLCKPSSGSRSNQLRRYSWPGIGTYCETGLPPIPPASGYLCVS